MTDVPMMRQLTANHIAANVKRWEDQIAAIYSMSVHEYISGIVDPSDPMWGDALTLQCIAEVFHLEINVVEPKIGWTPASATKSELIDAMVEQQLQTH